MALSDNLVVLQRTPLFAELQQEALRLLAFGAEQRKILKGDTLYRQGDSADCAYVVLSGVMEIWLQTPHKEQVRIRTLEKGSLMGEIALIMPTKRHFTAKAAENTDLLRINRDIFQRLMDEYPFIATLLQDRIQQSLRKLMAELHHLQQKFH